MSNPFRIRLPAPALVKQYEEAGLWIDRTLAQELEAGLIRNHAKEYRVWSEVRPCTTSVHQIHQRSLRIAAGFQKLGIGAGDVVSFQLPNWIEAVETFLATMFLGAVSVPVVQIYGEKEVGFILANTRAKLHVTTHSFRNFKYREMMESIRTRLPDLNNIIYIDQDWDGLLSSAPLAQVYADNPDAPAIIGFTSGTTSDPKGAIHTSRTVLAEVRQRHTAEPGDDRSAPLNPPRGYESWLTASPVAHVSGLQTAVLLPFLLDRRAGLIDQWDVDQVLKALLEGDLYLAAAATFFFNSILAHPSLGPEHLERLKYVVSGGSPVPRAFGEMCEKQGINLVRGYGSTEHPTIIGSAFDDPLDKRIGTDGRIMAGCEIELRDGEGNLVPPGTPGEIFSRGPDLFVGYTLPALTDEAFDDEGWFATGDVGVMDADGYITITDRTKDIIIRGGENISAAEVEDTLAKMDAILEVAAVAAPNEKFGEHVCVFIRVRPEMPAPTIEDLRLFLKSTGLAKQKWPEQIKIVNDFERTASGKIKKFELREVLKRTG